jgi:hypothetical protein
MFRLSSERVMRSDGTACQTRTSINGYEFVPGPGVALEVSAEFNQLSREREKGSCALAWKQARSGTFMFHS